MEFSRIEVNIQAGEFRETELRQALGTETLKSIYRRAAQRYDLQHGLVTFRTDEKGRKMLVRRTVREGDAVLDAGCGTGSTGILAARQAGSNGKVTFFDLSEDMLSVARQKIARENLEDRVVFQMGDLVDLPFDDDTFDVVLSTYSLCPVYDPSAGARELYRVMKPGGRLGIGHSAEPDNAVVKYLSDRVEDVVWRLPWLSMGCRSIDVLPALEAAGGKVLLSKWIGVPLWPFRILVVEKPG